MFTFSKRHIVSCKMSSYKVPKGRYTPTQGFIPAFRGAPCAIQALKGRHIIPFRWNSDLSIFSALRGLKSPFILYRPFGTTNYCGFLACTVPSTRANIAVKIEFRHACTLRSIRVSGYAYSIYYVETWRATSLLFL